MSRAAVVAFVLALSACGAGPIARVDAIDAVERIPAIFHSPSSSAVDGGALDSFSWDFGDGRAGVGQTTSHIYDVAGRYRVLLTVADEAKNEGRTAFDVNVQPLSSLTGRWSIDPSSSVALCEAGSYAVAFPGDALELLVLGTHGDVSVSDGAAELKGGFDAAGTLRALGVSDAWAVDCTHDGEAARLLSATEALQAEFDAPRAFHGTYTITLDFDVPFCNCAQVFDVAGVRP